jgi:hypothetical protein
MWPRHPHHSTILLFHHSKRRPIAPNKAKLGQPGASGERRRWSCTNKPNLAGRPLRPAASALRAPVAQTNPIPPGRDGARRTNKPNLPPPDGQARPWSGLLRQTNPISIKGGWGAAWGTWDVECCTNKPNSDRGHVKGKSCMGKELWLIIHAEDFGKTKPIPGGAGRSSPAARPSGLWPASVGCTNKPNLGCSVAMRDALVNKQTQFPVRWAPRGRPIAQNEPNHRPADRPPRFQYSTIPARCRSCKTKPICHRRAGKTIVKGKALGDATPQRAIVSKPVAHGKLDFALRGLPIFPGSGSIRLLWLHPHSQRQER